MQLKKHRKVLILLAAVGLVVGWIYRPCYYDGCYGPFEIVIRSENGERVEDVIVNLTHITVGFMGKLTHTYKESVMGNTGEAIRFPRDFVHAGDSEKIRLSYAIRHPDYATYDDRWVIFPNKKGIIGLGEKVIFGRQDLHKRSISRQIEKYRDQGYSEEAIDKKLEDARSFSPAVRLAPDYFGRLLSMGRQDIVDKYLPGYLDDYNQYKYLSATEAVKFEAKVMKNIRRYCRRYSKPLPIHCR